MSRLRTRLIAWVMAAAAAVLLLGGVALYLQVRSHLLRQLDGGLRERATLLASMVELDRGELETDFEDLDMREFERGGRSGLAIWLEERVVLQSPSLAGAWTTPPPLGRGSWVASPDGGVWRGIVLNTPVRVEGRMRATPPPMLTIALASDATEVGTTLRFLAVNLVVGGAVMLAVLAATVTGVVRRSVRPVEALAAAIGGVDPDRLGEPVAVPGMIAELQPVVRQFNVLLHRLEAAFERERAFSSDVAHELRTPLAGLRNRLEVARAKPRSSEDAARQFDAALAVVLQMQDLVERLLTVARLESQSQAGAESEVIGLAELVASVWRTIPEVDPAAEGVTVTMELDPAVAVVGESGLVRTAVQNVLSNAWSHVDRPGRIEITARSESGDAMLRVSNTGSRVAAGDAERVFDRLWRGEASRSDTGVHAGLGLSIVRLAVEALGGRASVTTEAGGRFTMTLHLPAAASPTEPGTARCT